MENRRFLFFIVLSGLLLNCNADDILGKDDKATSFEGKIVFSDNEEPVRGSILITGLQNRFPSDRSIVENQKEISSDGSFSLNFERNDAIDYFIITIGAIGDEPLVYPINSYDCGSINCNNLSPGIAYDNIEIRAERSQ